MIEQGLVMLVQGDASVAAIAPTGGFFAQLPQDYSLPSWTYATVSDSTDYELSGPVALGSRRLQIDCYGSTAAQAIQLAKAVDAVLNGYRGTLADPDATVVQGCFRNNKLDFFDDANRSYRRMVEYIIWFVE